MKTIIMFPTNSASLILGRRLLNSEHNVLLYCPNEVHKRQAGTIPNELKIASMGLGVRVEVTATLEMFVNSDFLIFPTLDILPYEKRSDYAQMCQTLFRNMKLDGVKFKDGVSVIFGANLSGLICAKEFGDIFPGLRKSTYVTSSIYSTSRQIYSDSQDRALQMIRSSGAPKIYFTGDDNNEMLIEMGRVWDIDDYCNTEAAAILDVINGITDMAGDLSGLEIIGRFAKAEEATKYNICPTIPVWLSTREDASQFDNENIAERLRRMSDWMETGYDEA